MARKLVSVEISVVSCNLIKTLAGRKKESSHLAQSSLIWPRSGISSRSSACKLPLRSGECQLVDESWSKRILFKENIESTFAIKVDITEAIGNDALEEFLRYMAGAVLSLGSDVMEDASPAGSVVSAPVDYLAKKVKKVPDADIIASGSVDISVDDIPAKGELVLHVALTSPLDVIKRSRRTINRKTKVTRKVLMKKDEPNGELTLLIKRI